MRTTLTIDDDVLAAARELAMAEGRTIGQVLSDLVRRALRPQRHTDSEGGFPVFAVPGDAPPITPDMVMRAREDDG